PRPYPLSGEPSQLQFSPDGTRLVFALAPSPRLDDYLLRRRLQIWEVASARTLGQIENPGKLGIVQWSPDGQSIVFTSGADSSDPVAGRLMVAPAAGGAPKLWMPQFVPNIVDFGWSSASV